MAGNGGKREGAGRKSKADEILLIEKLTPMAPEAYKQLEKGIKAGDFRFVKLYFEYYAGKPKETKDITSNGQTLDFNQISFFDTDEDK